MDRFDFSLVRQSGDEQPASAHAQRREPKDIQDSPEFIEMFEALARRAAENRKL
jgi:hypothetical protein